MPAKILFVDAHPADVQIMTAVAKAAKAQFWVVESLEAARNISRTEHPDVVVSDVDLPDGCGIELIGFLRNLDEQSAVMMTSRETKIERVVDAIKAGAVDFLQKPFSPNQFATVLAGLFQRLNAQGLVFEASAAVTTLIVEDDPLTLPSTGMFLSTFGILSWTAKSLVEARQLLDSHSPDVVIIDVFIGSGSGFGLMAELKVERPFMPIIVVTASDKPEIAIQALRTGAFTVLTKPVDREALYRAILAAHRNRMVNEERLRLQSEIEGQRAETERLSKKLEEASQNRGLPASSDPSSPSNMELKASALQSLPSGILVLDANCHVREMNPVSEDLLGLSRGELLDRGLDTAPALVTFFEAAQQVISRGVSFYNQEAEVHLRRGRRVMGFGVAPITGGSGVGGALVFFQDITSKKRTEGTRRVTERLASLGMIAASITQESANAISLATGYSDLIIKDSSNSSRTRLQAEKIKTVLQRAGQLSSHVSKLIRAPRAEIGPCDLHEIISEVWKLLERKTPLGTSRSSAWLDAKVARVMGDPLDFEYLFLTLIVNVCEGMSPGGTIQIKTLNHTGVLEIDIESLGSDGETATPGSGKETSGDGGPGLDICRSIVNRLGGAIRFEQRTPGTRRFTILLPPARPEDCSKWAVPVGPLPPIVASSPPGEKAVTLIVPEEETAKLCRQWLEEAGLKVFRYSDPQEGLAAYQHDQPSLFVLDMEKNNTDCLGFLSQVSDRSLAPVVVLLEESVAPKRLADLEDFTCHRLMCRPLRRERLLQALALAELEHGRNRAAVGGLPKV